MAIFAETVFLADRTDVLQQPAVIQVEGGVDELALVDADSEQGHFVDAEERLVEDARHRRDGELLVGLIGVEAEAHGRLPGGCFGPTCFTACVRLRLRGHYRHY
jgi:hypothetical protein